MPAGRASEPREHGHRGLCPGDTAGADGRRRPVRDGGPAAIRRGSPSKSDRHTLALSPSHVLPQAFRRHSGGSFDDVRNLASANSYRARNSSTDASEALLEASLPQLIVDNLLRIQEEASEDDATAVSSARGGFSADFRGVAAVKCFSKMLIRNPLRSQLGSHGAPL